MHTGWILHESRKSPWRIHAMILVRFAKEVLVVIFIDLARILWDSCKKSQHELCKTCQEKSWRLLARSCKNLARLVYMGSAFVFPTTAIAQAPHFDIYWQYRSQERPTKILTTLPWWLQLCTDTYMTKLNLVVVSAVMIFCFPSGCHCSLDTNSMVITWRALIGMNHKLAAYNYTGSL